MHTRFAITVPSTSTDGLVEDLQGLEQVMSVSVHRGASVKPPGDTLDVVALNRGADEVMRRLERERGPRPISVSTLAMSSLIDTQRPALVAGDVDDTIWEVQETRLRHHNQPTLNYSLLMAAGGVIATCGALNGSLTGVVAVVAAGVISPGFESLAKLPLAAVLLRGNVAWHGLKSTVIGYLALIVAAAATEIVLHAGGTVTSSTLLKSRLVEETLHPGALGLLISAAGAVAGVVMIAADNTDLLAGALIALSLIPAAAILGASAVAGDGHLVARSCERLAIDAGFIVAAGVIVFGYKQLRSHRRRPLV